MRSIFFRREDYEDSIAALKGEGPMTENVRISKIIAIAVVVIVMMAMTAIVVVHWMDETHPIPTCKAGEVIVWTDHTEDSDSQPVCIPIKDIIAS